MYPRFIERRIRDALSDTRVVMIAGPRQSGKTTLARKIAGDDIPFLTLDDATTLDAATADPVGFVRGIDHAVDTLLGPEDGVLREAAQTSSRHGDVDIPVHVGATEERVLDVGALQAHAQARHELQEDARHLR